MDYGELTRKLVADAIINKLPGLTKTVTFHYQQSAGEYDEETDTTTPVYTNVANVVCVGAKPTFGDVKERNVQFTDIKLIVPGTSLPSRPEDDTDRVTIDGELWNIRKAIEVPGKSVYLIFCNRL